MNRHIIWSVNYNWFKGQRINCGGIFQPILMVQRLLRYFLKEVQVSYCRKCLL